MKPALARLNAVSRRTKQLVLVAADLLALPPLFWAALALRYETIAPPLPPYASVILPVIGAFCVTVLALSGVYRAVVRAFDEKFLHSLMRASAIVAGVLFALAATRILTVPRTTPLLHGTFVFMWVWASRSIIRHVVHLLARANTPATRVVIYGAGAAGRQILSALRAAPEYLPVGFLDDAEELAGTMVQGLRVYRGRDVARAFSRLSPDEVLIALPSATRERRREIIEALAPFPVRVRTLPALTQIVGGDLSISDIRQVDIVDLLGRDPVPPMSDLIDRDIRGKRVLVTGAGGSIGSELCRQVLACSPALLVLCDVSEYALYTIERELSAIPGAAPCVPVLGSVLHEARMAKVMREYGINTVYHAAAYKHVPLVESNPFEGIVNNTVGTYRTARAAIVAGVSTFVLISTDKAVRPTNVMGASKRLAEMVLQALAAEPGLKPRFCIVRFGNVLGSSGSVVPLFCEQIAKGGPVTVTHPEVTRYFMTIPEAAQLVIQAGAMGSGGDVFVLDMGESVKIVDLARKMIRLSGKSVREKGGQGEIEIVFSGLRPGEKLYEELLIGNNVTPTEHPRIMKAKEAFIPLSKLEPLIERLREMAREHDVSALKRALVQVVEGYQESREQASVPSAEPMHKVQDAGEVTALLNLDSLPTAT